MASDILSSLMTLYGRNSTDSQQCEEHIISDNDFYLVTLLPALTTMVMFSFTRRRTSLWPHILSGRPGLLYPMDTMTRSSRLSYACAFGATAVLIYNIILKKQYVVEVDGNSQLESLIAIVSMFVYGIVYYPVLACLALETAFSYGVGSLYAWLFLMKEIENLIACRDLPTKAIVILVARNLPMILCAAYLSVSLPLRFVRALLQGRYFTSPADDDIDTMTLVDVRESFQGKYVTELFSKPESTKPPVDQNKCLSAVIRLFHRIFYKKQKGFRYPARLLSVMVVAAIVVYVSAVSFLVWLLNFVDAILDIFADTEYVDYFTSVGMGCLIVTVALSTIMSFVVILHTMSSFRDNLRAVYRADYKYIPSPYENSGKTLCVGSMKYAGFQVAYIGWSFLLTSVVIFILTLIISAIVTLIKFGYTDWIVEQIILRWPWLLITIIVWVVQDLLAKFVFLRDSGQYMRLDNRHLFFICTYFLFFYNIFLGLISCLLRILKAVGIGLFMLARLDNSTLPRRWEWLDPGFTAYQGFIHMEAAHTHPVVIVMINLLAALRNERRKKNKGSHASDKFEAYGNTTHCSDKNMYNLTCSNLKYEVIGGRVINRAARFNWHVTYTLLTNPTIRVYRKGYMQALKIAQREGLKIPMSDRPVGDFDLVQLQKEKMERMTVADDKKKLLEKENSMQSKINLLKKKVNRVGDKPDKQEKDPAKKDPKISMSNGDNQNSNEEYPMDDFVMRL